DADGLLAVVRGGRVSDALKAFADAGFAFDSDAGYAALIEAIGDEKIEVARFLIQRGAPLRSERPNPLCRAASTRSSKMIDALLALGADPNALGSGGMTPLAIAVEELATGCVRSLLRAGADPNLGRTPPPFCITTGIRHAIEDGYRPGDEVYEIVRALA